jgi:hypothetical protein
MALAENRQNQSLIARARGIAPLVELARIGCAAAQEHAVGTLARLAEVRVRESRLVLVGKSRLVLTVASHGVPSSFAAERNGRACVCCVGT